MESKLILKPGEDTPEITFDPGGNVFSISGRSLPEDAFSFYAPVQTWMKSYTSAPNPASELVVFLEYFNSSSVKQLLILFSQFEQISSSGKQAKITWCYAAGDDLMEIKGEEFKSMLELPFELKSV
jgi:hypothetical protein